MRALMSRLQPPAAYRHRIYHAAWRRPHEGEVLLTPISSPEMSALVKENRRSERRIWHHTFFAAKFRISKINHLRARTRQNRPLTVQVESDSFVQ